MHNINNIAHSECVKYPLIRALSKLNCKDMLNHNSKYLQWSTLWSMEFSVNVFKDKGRFSSTFFSSSISRNSQPIKGAEHNIGIIVLKVGDVCNKIEISIYCSVRKTSN